MWTIWKTRNDVVFNKVLSSPAAIIYKSLMLVKSWRPLLKPKLKPMADNMINLLSAGASLTFKLAL
jgi:hypothetical protein